MLAEIPINKLTLLLKLLLLAAKCASKSVAIKNRAMCRTPIFECVQTTPGFYLDGVSNKRWFEMENA